MKRGLEARMGVLPNQLQVVYRFDGERSADVFCTPDSFGKGGWTQRHNPFLGVCSPAMFSQSLEEWHLNNFDVDGGCGGQDCVYHEILYAVSGRSGVVFAAAEGVIGSVASEYMKEMALQIGANYEEVETVDAGEFPVHGYTPPSRAFGICFFQLPPNTFLETKPYDCCDGHRVVSELASYLTQLKKSRGGVAAATALHPFLFKPLQCPVHVSAHHELWEMEYGGFYREMLDFKARKRSADVTGAALRELSRRTRGATPFQQTLKGHAAENLFKKLNCVSRADCFLSRKARKSVVAFFKTWLEDTRVDAAAWLHALRQFCYSAVPVDASKQLMQDFMDAPAPCVFPELKLLFFTSAFRLHSQTMQETLHCVLSAQGSGCLDTLPRILSFLGSCEAVTWSRFDAALQETVAASFSRERVLKKSAIRLSIKNLRGLKTLGVADARVPATFWSLLARRDEEDDGCCSHTIFSRLLYVGAHPGVLLDGVFAVAPPLQDKELHAVVNCFQEGVLTRGSECPVASEHDAFLHTLAQRFGRGSNLILHIGGV